MANTIQIKRSTTAPTPGAGNLAEGELAYSENSSTLFIGTGAGANVTDIGGKIGVTVQAYDANLVSDATYVATDVNFSTALSTKLANIEENATADQTKGDIDALNVDAGTVNSYSVGKSVPSNAVFTDTTYTIGDNGLTEKNFTTALATKLGNVDENANAYSLPTATTLAKGGVQIGANLSIDGSGVLSADAQAYSLPIASVGTLGGFKVGTGLDINSATGVLNATGVTPGDATTTVSGLMSGTDKGILDGLNTWYGTMTTADSDNIINTINEVFAAFSTAGESLDVAASLGLKLDDASTIDGGTF